MHKRIVSAPLAVLVTALLSVFAASAFGQEELTFYAGAGVGQVSVALDDVLFDESDTGFKLFGGALFNPYFGLEAALWSGAKTQLATGRAEIEPSAFVVQGIGRYPFLERFSVYGKLGVGFYRLDVVANTGGFVYDDSESGNELVFGAGASTIVWRGIEARVEWEQFAFDIDGEDGKTSMISLSGVYRF